MSAESGKDADPQRTRPSGRRRGHRRVTAPGTSGLPEQSEPEIFVNSEDRDNHDDAAEDARGQWLKSERPPHWG